MKRNIFIIGATVCSLLLSGCEKDFLDVKPSGGQLTPEQLAEAAKKDPSLLNGYIAGLYQNMYATYTGGTTNHTDFGQKGYDIYGDMLAGDMVLAGVTYGWYSDIARYTATKDYTTNTGYMPWRYYYRIIQGANSVMDAMGGDQVVPTEPAQRHIMGQAKAMRAYSYFYLSQFFAPEYGSGQDKFLPIYRDTKVPNQPKATQEEVYNLIVSDLTEAIDYLKDFDRSSKDQIDVTVAQGLLSYALAARGTNADLEKVVELTNDVLTKGGYTITSGNQLVGGFNDVSTPSWMWGVDLTVANGLDLVSWWGQVDYFTYSYSAAGDRKTIDASLYASFPAGDARKSQFHSTALLPWNKFYDPDRVAMGQRVIETDYVYMRMEEMILLNAEAKARLNQDALAKDMLRTLMSKRINAANYPAYELYLTGLSGQTLKDEILKQTRIELWGEGKAYLAIKRNKATITRGSNHLYHAGSSFAWNSDELTFEIPQAEVLNNPALNN